jgi:integrase
VKKADRYYVVVDRYENGKRKRKWHPAGRTRREADDKLIEILGAIKRGVYVDPSRTTVTDYLEQTWLPAIRATIKPTTYQLYETVVSAYIKPHDLGGMRLQEVRGAHLNALYAKLGESGRKNGQPLAPKSIRNVHTLLYSAFRDAMKWDLLARNPAEAADPPIVPRKAPAHWTADRVGAFLEATADDRLAPLWLMYASTALRRSEALALRWSDVSLEHGRASIHRSLAFIKGQPLFTEPKTPASQRTVPLPTETVAVLKAHRKRQAAERLAAGELWQDLDLIFALEDGSPIPPGRVTKTFVRAVKRAGLPHLAPHGLRHTFATVALEAGVLTKIVTDILGHSSVAITADLYSHTTEPSTRDASDRVASAMFGRSTPR